MDKILLIGLGSIGYRYFQAIIKIPSKKKLYIFDINKKVSKKIIIYKDKNIIFTNNFDDLPSKVDLVILSTTTNGRAKLLKKLTKKTIFKYIIIEKPLAQSQNELLKLNNLLKNKISWVNTDRRSLKIYRDVKKILNLSKQIKMKIIGNEWGICCNSLHFIDLFNYLCNRQIKSIHEKKKFNWVMSKRKNFYELENGTLNIEYDQHLLQLVSTKGKKSNLKITIFNNSKKLIVDENSNLMSLKYNKKNKYYNNSFTSVKMTKIISKILKNGSCTLPSYHNSSKLYEPLIIFLLQKWKEKNKFAKFVPIT